MIDLLRLGNFSGFIFIIFIIIVIKLIIGYIGTSTSTSLSDSTPIDTSSNSELNDDISVSVEESGDDVILEIKRQDLYKTIISIKDCYIYIYI